TEGWMLEKQQGEFEWSVEDLDAGALPEGQRPQGRAVHLKVGQTGDAEWRQQVHQNGLDFANGATYTIQFWAKADKARPLPLYASLDQEPWRHIGGDHTVQLSSGWRRFTVLMTAKDPLPDHNRLSFVLGTGTGDVWLADVSIRRGTLIEFEPGQSLEAGTIPLTRGSDTPQGRDYFWFLMEVERRYAQTMRDYVRNELGAKSLVACSQAWLGGLGGVLRESRLDWVDMHAYWQHPEFPRKSWDAKDWRIANTAMVREFGGGTLPHLAQHRVAGKPFTVTEYNHPAPNDYASEAMPLICAYAAWQDWDGIFLFGYYGDDEGWNTNKIRNFFDADSDPNKMATMPVAAMLFLGGAVPPATKRSTLVVPYDSIVALTARLGLPNFWASNVSSLWNAQGATRRDWLSSRLAIRLVPGSGAARLQRDLVPEALPEAVTWHTDSPGTALFTVNAPRAKAAIGFLGGQWTDLGGFVVEMEKTPRNFVTLALTAMDNQPIAQSKSLLLTALSNVENKGMGWNADRTSVSDQWGTGPTLAEGIPATIHLRTSASKATVYALDGRGKRLKPVPAQLKNNRLTFRIGPTYKTLWYEIAAQPGTAKPKEPKLVKPGSPPVSSQPVATGLPNGRKKGRSSTSAD
ncbi:MAG: hypothetical protein M3347_10370, partial [Armatimonadota bacterium]|nr:hypothetical protein [Armatimonadota bacterium]